MTSGKFFSHFTNNSMGGFTRLYFQNLHGATFRYNPAIAMADGYAFDRKAEFNRTFDAIPYDANEISFCAEIPSEVADAMPVCAYKLGNDLEENGYNDSDWRALYFFPETGKIENVLTGSTRFADSLRIRVCDVELSLTQEIAEYCADLLFLEKFPAYIKADKFIVEHPQEIEISAEYILKEKHAARNLWAICDKCNGSGNWTNPNRASDVRDCFACKSAGVIKTEGKAKALPVGLSGKAIAKTVYFPPYCKNGQVTVTLQTDSGFVRVPLEKIAESRGVDFTDCEKQARKEANNFIVTKTSGYSNYLNGDIAANVLSAAM